MTTSKPKKPSTRRRAGVSVAIRSERRNAVNRKPSAPTTRRGSQTRDKLKEACVRVLERMGYRAMRLADIAEEAEVNVSLLYHYFTGKADLTHEILAELLDQRKVRDLIGPATDDRFDAILRANQLVTRTYAETPGLMRCLLHFDEEEAEFSKLYQKISNDWSQRVARDIARRCPDSPLSENERLMIAYALGGMVDNFLFEKYVDRNPDFATSFTTQEEVSRFLSIIWYRALYLENPPADKLAGYEGFARLTMPNPTTQ